MERIPNVGPLPKGKYTFSAPFKSQKTGRFTMRLHALPGTDLFGRSDFMIHGDSESHPGEASTGCIVLRLRVRNNMWNSGDHTIIVE